MPRDFTTGKNAYLDGWADDLDRFDSDSDSLDDYADRSEYRLADDVTDVRFG